MSTRGESEPAASAGRLLVLSFALLAPYLIGRAWIASTWPYQQGFDDFDHIPAALEWAQHRRLTSGGLFLRVPLWHILLGSFFLVFGTTAGLFVLQASIVWGTLLAYLTYVERVLHRDARGLLLLPPLAFVSSPQVLLYGRHAVNEPFLGLLAVGVLLVGALAFRGRAVVLGLLCGAGSMTKTIATALVIPALTDLLAARTRTGRTRALALFAVGMAVVVAPLVTLHFVQRGPVPLDTTAAYNLSTFEPRQWLAQGDHMARHAAGMQAWRADIAADPAGYLADFAGRFATWWARPGSADFAHFYRDYPHAWIRAWDHGVLYAFLLLAAFGTRRRHLSVWAFLAILAVGCTFPRHTPYSPKLILIFPTLLLAASGILRLSDRLPARAGRTREQAPVSDPVRATTSR
ncbi:hypothetical protein KJ059_00360 [Myxococcota bacterium]|nr:hypothetical protein [Myxococcota bacterium]MCZ7617438.1 hypothetical protein [Myxococcota bacterium]